MTQESPNDVLTTTDKLKPMTVQEVADRLNCSDDTVRILIRQKKLKAFSIGTLKQPVYRVEREWVEEFVNGTSAVQPSEKIEEKTQSKRPSLLSPKKSHLREIPKR